MVQFLPTELLYTPVKTHAGLQYVCLRSLIVSIVMFYTEIRHLFAMEPPISVLPLAKALLRLVIVLAVAVLRSILSAVKTRLFLWFGYLFGFCSQTCGSFQWLFG